MEERRLELERRIAEAEEVAREAMEWACSAEARCAAWDSVRYLREELESLR